ncbi:MAG TPA: dTDP-4-dehydrorhamnose reductase, partial [Desulfobacteria bacterium]|nr:dTDP-4-dehydrorhamnose reductase [Desulfobacteria bacterium]
MKSKRPTVFEQPKIMLIGKNGQVGWELMHTLSPLGQVVALDRNQINLVDPVQIRNCVRQINPGIIVNAAAYTDVEKAEDDVETAKKVNSYAVEILAEEAKRIGAILIHYSTDYVFDGTKNRPYNEDDTPNPLNSYGRTKLAGENAILASGASHLILRTSWVYGLRRKNFMLTILRLAQERKQIDVVVDQIGCPTWSRSIAELTSLMLV